MRYLPFIFFLMVAAGLGFALFSPEPKPATPLLNQNLPQFTLTQLEPEGQFDSGTLRGEVAIINIFASWCTACISEHPVLTQLGKAHDVPIYGIAWKDKPEDTQAWLAARGNPYRAVALDPEGKAAIALGIAGVPESFVIDRKGRIRSRIAGAIVPESSQELLSLIEALRDEN